MTNTHLDCSKKILYLVKQFEHLSRRGKFVMQTGLVPICNVVQPDVGEQKLEPVKRHCGCVDRICVLGPELLKKCFMQQNVNLTNKMQCLDQSS